MSARDELAGVISAELLAAANESILYPLTTLPEQEAAHAILAAGYSKPRTITTASERAQLGAGTIAVDVGGNAWKRGTGSWVSTGGDTGPLYDDMDLTLTVLYTPKES